MMEAVESSGLIGRLRAAKDIANDNLTVAAGQ